METMNDKLNMLIKESIEGKEILAEILKKLS
jgi:hypothetical protein